MDRHIALNVHKLNPVVGHPVLEHAEVDVVDGDLEGSRLGQDEDVEMLPRHQGHSPEALFISPDVVDQRVPHDAVLVPTHAQVQGYVVPRVGDAARLQVYRESRR